MSEDPEHVRLGWLTKQRRETPNTWPRHMIIVNADGEDPQLACDPDGYAPSEITVSLFGNVTHSMTYSRARMCPTCAQMWEERRVPEHTGRFKQENFE